MKKRLNRSVVCADGFRMSVQANETAYCDPRDNTGPYTEVEVGFPNREEPMLCLLYTSPSPRDRG